MFFIDTSSILLPAEVQEICQNLLSCPAAFLRMELGSIKVIFMQRSTERMNIVSYSSSKVAGRHIEAMHKIDKLLFGEAFKQFAIRLPNGVPSHVRHFIFMFLRDKTFYVHIEDIQTIDFSFFGIPAHQLHTENKFPIQADGDSLSVRPVS